jgi:hypothetical protein
LLRLSLGTHKYDYLNTLNHDERVILSLLLAGDKRHSSPTPDVGYPCTGPGPTSLSSQDDMRTLCASQGY